MSPKRQTTHVFLVKSKTPPIVELDVESQAAYVRFKKGVVARTVTHPDEHLHVAVDVDKSGEVIGIELVGGTYSHERQLRGPDETSAPTPAEDLFSLVWHQSAPDQR
jgi:uncharacterized protein YuzE